MMRRGAPHYNADEIMARCVLDPNGDHRLEIETPNGIMLVAYGAKAIPALEAAIAQHRALCTRADGGPDFHNRRTISLEVKK